MECRGGKEKRTLPDIALALTYLDEILRRYRNHSGIQRVLAMKALILATRPQFGMPPIPDLKEAEALVRRALEGSGQFWEAHFAAGAVEMILHKDWRAARVRQGHTCGEVM